MATDDTILPMLSRGQTHPACLWVYVGDESNPYNVFDFTVSGADFSASANFLLE